MNAWAPCVSTPHRTTGVLGSQLRNGDRRVVGGVHHGGDVATQAPLHGVQHRSDAAHGGTVHGKAVRGRLDVRHE